MSILIARFSILFSGYRLFAVSLTSVLIIELFQFTSVVGVELIFLRISLEERGDNLLNKEYFIHKLMGF